MAKRIKAQSGEKRPVEEPESESEYSDVVESGSELEEVSDNDEPASGDEDVSDEEEVVAESSDEEEEEVDKFAESMSKILGSRVKVQDRENPVLIRNNITAKEIENSKLEAKARAVMRAEKLQHKDKARVKDIIPKDPEAAGDAMSREKMLRKIAQRGIVRLFNAVNEAQKIETENADEKKQDKVTALSKDKFLDVIRGG